MTTAIDTAISEYILSIKIESQQIAEELQIPIEWSSAILYFRKSKHYSYAAEKVVLKKLAQDGYIDFGERIQVV